MPIAAHFAGFGDRPTFADVIPLARLVTDDYLAASYGRIDLVYPRFVSTLVQRPRWSRCCRSGPAADTEGIPGNQFIFEPEPGEPCWSSSCRATSRRASTRRSSRRRPAEESSRMVAMKNATENAEDLIEDLTLAYNKVRQANITREMIEIATGAQAR